MGAGQSTRSRRRAIGSMKNLPQSYNQCKEDYNELGEKYDNLKEKYDNLQTNFDHIQTKNESGKYTYIDGDGNFVTPLKAGKRRTRRTRNTRRKRKTF